MPNNKPGGERAPHRRLQATEMLERIDVVLYGERYLETIASDDEEGKLRLDSVVSGAAIGVMHVGCRCRRVGLLVGSRTGTQRAAKGEGRKGQTQGEKKTRGADWVDAGFSWIQCNTKYFLCIQFYVGWWGLASSCPRVVWQRGRQRRERMAEAWGGKCISGQARPWVPCVCAERR